MSSPSLSVKDEEGSEGKGGEEGVERQDTSETRGCVHNGVVAEEVGDGDEESEIEDEEEVLYETSSQEILESTSGSGESEGTLEER